MENCTSAGQKSSSPGCTKKCKLFVKFANISLRLYAPYAMLIAEQMEKEGCGMVWYFTARNEDVDDMIFPDDTWTRSER